MLKLAILQVCLEDLHQRKLGREEINLFMLQKGTAQSLQNITEININQKINTLVGTFRTLAGEQEDIQPTCAICTSEKVIFIM